MLSVIPGKKPSGAGFKAQTSSPGPEAEPSPTALGAAIQAYRRHPDRRWEQADMARHCGVPPAIIGKLERGDQSGLKTRLGTCAKICLCAHWSLEHFYSLAMQDEAYFKAKPKPSKPPPQDDEED